MKAHFEMTGVSGARTDRGLCDALPRPADRTPGHFQLQREAA